MQQIRRILLSRMKFIGDVVLTTPVIHAVRAHYPDAYIAYLAERNAASLLEHNPYLDEVIPYNFDVPSILEQIRVIRLLRKRKFDVVVDLFSNPRTALLTRASGAPMRIGKDVSGRGRAYTHRIGDYGRMKPAVEFHFQYVKPLGVEQTHIKTEIFLTDDEKREARIFLQSLGVDLSRPIVAFHPGASWPNKRWLPERFAELITLLRAKLGAETLLSPGPGDDSLIADISNRCIAHVHKLPLLPVRQLAGILSRCDVFVSNDCGPMHIGVAVGTKTIGIFGPEPPEVWFSSYSSEEGHTAFFRKIECSPCRDITCRRDAEGFMECMQLISAGDVFREVAQRIGGGVSTEHRA